MSDTKSEASLEGSTTMYVEKFFYDELATANKELRAKHERVLQMLDRMLAWAIATDPKVGMKFAKELLAETKDKT